MCYPWERPQKCLWWGLSAPLCYFRKGCTVRDGVAVLTLHFFKTCGFGGLSLASSFEKQKKAVVSKVPLGIMWTTGFQMVEVGLNDLGDLFQPKRFSVSVILRSWGFNVRAGLKVSLLWGGGSNAFLYCQPNFVVERYYGLCIWFSLSIQFPGLLLNLQILNFSSDHCVYEEVATVLKVCFLKTCKDIRVFKYCMSKLMPNTGTRIGSKMKMATKVKYNFCFPSFKYND